MHYNEKVIKFLDEMAKKTDDPEEKDMLRIAARDVLICHKMEQIKHDCEDDGK